MSVHQRQQQQKPADDERPLSLRAAFYGLAQRPISSDLFGRAGLLSLLALLVLLGVLLPCSGPMAALSSSPSSFSPRGGSLARWKDYTLAQAAGFATRNGTVVVCAVSRPYLPFLSNWLVGVARQNRQDQVVVVAEDYATLYEVNRRWPGHAVLVSPAPDSQAAHKFGSQEFFNFTSRRPRHLLHLLELGYSVMYNDVDMVWLADPFPYLEGNHDVYLTDDMAAVKPLNHPHDLPPPGKRGRTYICSCMIFLRPTQGAKEVMKSWIQELENQPWSKRRRSNDEPAAFNWALNRTAGQVDLYLLPQAAFPSGGLYFKNESWVKETKGLHVIVHNNYVGADFDKKMKGFQDHGLWSVDDHAHESPLGPI